MNRILLAFFLSAFFSFCNAQIQVNTTDKHGCYMNPVFAGDHPDPSLLREGNDYYIVHSSFDYYPGLLIWHSQDLINWEPVTNALHKNVGSVWAPDIVKYEDTYYIYFPANNTNYVVTAKSIHGPWSDPVDLKIGQIDPGHFTDDKGNRYLYFSSGDYVALSKDGLRVTGEQKRGYEGWPIPEDWTIECFCLEGPKLFKRGDYYYITVAEGGTAGPATSHMVISARSKSPFGPWENSPYNPVLRTMSKSEQWWSKGHSTIFEDHNGKWWMVFHGYENGFYNMGRQTLLQPVEWTKDGWYKIQEGTKTEEPIAKPKGNKLNFDFALSDNFEGSRLKPHWKFFGGNNEERVTVENNTVAIDGKGKNVGTCSPLTCVPSHHSYTVDVEMIIEGEATGGLVLFYNNSYYSGILADKENILANLREWQFVTEKGVVQKSHVFLRLKNDNNTVDMYYSHDGNTWKKIENSAEVSSYNHNVLSGFLSLRIGLCSIGDGQVKFKNFKYTEAN